jgi:diguanylate cyclase (GGDEF)-like protein/PAS domain S-box-containing protein
MTIVKTLSSIVAGRSQRPADRGLRTKLTLEAVLLALLAATLASIVWQDTILRRAISIGPNSGTTYVSYGYGDAPSGGNSTFVLDPKRPLAWQCVLGDAYQYPYCGYELLFDDKKYERGKDLSGYRTLTLSLDYRGHGKSLRLNLKNYDPRYSVRGKTETYKFNTVEFPVRPGLQTVRIDLATLTVADWWITERKIPPALKDPQLDNVISIDVQSGTGWTASTHQFQLHDIVLEGPVLAPEQWYLSMLVAWLVLIGLFVAWRIYGLERTLEESEALKSGAFEASPDWISLLDLDGIVLYVNKTALDSLGVPEQALVGKIWAPLIPAEAIPDRNAAIAAARAGQVGRLSVSLATGRGETRWLESLVAPLRNPAGEIIRLVVMTRDISHQKSIEDQVRWTAAHDMLTELPNRRLFHERLEQEIRDHAERGFALLMLDIDDFKQVNDALGHDAGDHLLRTAAERLRGALRKGDFVARLGGDEFAVILHDVPNEKTLEAAAQALHERLSGPWVHEGRISDLRISIGSSLYPRHGHEASLLLKNADVALYAAKTAGRGRTAVFAPKMRAATERHSAMLAMARTAVADDLIVPYYQPKVDLEAGRVVGFEALLRWRHPSRGIQAPASIAAAFEDVEIAARITERMIERTVADVARWRDRGVDFGHVAINAAAADFRKGDFAEQLLERIHAAGVPAHCFQVEVTETVFLGRGALYVERALQTLRAAGIRVALDDFGTGYASLSHLKQFAVDIIKIDRSFVSDLEHDADDAAIIRAVVGLGRSLDLDVVAEGIESEAQHAYLLAEGCRFGQGFLYGKAAPASRVPGLLIPGQRSLQTAA